MEVELIWINPNLEVLHCFTHLLLPCEPLTQFTLNEDPSDHFARRGFWIRLVLLQIVRNSHRAREVQFSSTGERMCALFFALNIFRPSISMVGLLDTGECEGENGGQIKEVHRRRQLPHGRSGSTIPRSCFSMSASFIADSSSVNGKKCGRAPPTATCSRSGTGPRRPFALGRLAQERGARGGSSSRREWAPRRRGRLPAG